MAFGMEVIAHDPMLSADHPVWAATGVRCVSLDALLAQADAVSLHVLLVGAARNLIDVGRLASMKSGAVLINTARGDVVDEAALADALRAERSTCSAGSRCRPTARLPACPT
ncbi:hypothetical protein Tamer19_69760 [Cupriavidus sp. TA19]|nr:hypothetical protein Tamer19_69760 [Cupriavidus sp. TA19]